MDWTAVVLTFQLAVCTTAILLVLGLPIGYWLSRSTWRYRYLVDAVIALPLVLPPTVLGFYVLLATGIHSPLGRWYESATGSMLPFSFPGILLGSVLCNVPFAVGPFAAAFSRIDTSLIEASWCLGAGRAETFRRIVIPLAWPGILAGLVLTFAHTVGEFGVVLMIGGNIPGVTRTLSIAIYDDVQALNYLAAGQTSLVLLVFSFLVLCATYGLQRRGLLA